MVTRIGHIALHVADLDAAVDFQQQVIGMVETERVGGASYLTCNERHHELILIEDRANRGYEHLALEVAGRQRPGWRGEAADGRRRHAARRRLRRRARHRPRAARSARPAATSTSSSAAWRPSSRRRPATGRSSSSTSPARSRNHRAEERFLTDGLGLRFSDRMGFLASWWHCDEDHHGIALTRAHRSELSHYAYQWSDFAALGRVADRLKAARGRKCIWGPSRHGPGNNHFLYLHDEDGAMIECCSELARMQHDGYEPQELVDGPAHDQPVGRPAAAALPPHRLPDRRRRSPAAPPGRCAPTARPRPPEPDTNHGAMTL